MVDPLVEQLRGAKELYKELERVDELLAALGRGLAIRNVPLYELSVTYLNSYVADLLNGATTADVKPQEARDTQSKYKATFMIQPGAAEGKSVCKLSS